MGSVTGSSLGIEAIGQFETLTNTYSAQFGGNGGVINAVSRSGTNQFHGSAYEFLRNSDLDARQFIDPSQIPAYPSESIRRQHRRADQEGQNVLLRQLRRDSAYARRNPNRLRSGL